MTRPVRGRAFSKQEAKVLRELDEVLRGDARTRSPIEEQLRQCPEAFKVGELIGKMCDRLKYDHPAANRLQPPAGILAPPIV